jgi:hypothetical protein
VFTELDQEILLSAMINIANSNIFVKAYMNGLNVLREESVKCLANLQDVEAPGHPRSFFVWLL